MIVLALVVAAVAAARGMWSPCGLSMLSTLNPMSERARGHRPWVTAVWYVLGAVAGGALLGGAAALLALAVDVPQDWRFGAACVLAVLCVLSDAGVGVRLPDHPRQVNETWLARYRRWIYAAGFGLQIGAGFATYIMTAAVYLTAALAVLSGPAGALLVGLTFGLARGLGVMVTAGVSSPERLRALLSRVDVLAAPSLAAVCAVEAAVAVACAYVAGGLLAAAPVAVALLALVAAPLAYRHLRWSGRPAAGG
jgi:MFS family permease